MELLIDRVIVFDEQVKIRYVAPSMPGIGILLSAKNDVTNISFTSVLHRKVFDHYLTGQNSYMFFPLTQHRRVT